MRDIKRYARLSSAQTANPTRAPNAAHAAELQNRAPAVRGAEVPWQAHASLLLALFSMLLSRRRSCLRGSCFRAGTKQTDARTSIIVVHAFSVASLSFALLSVDKTCLTYRIAPKKLMPRERGSCHANAASYGLQRFGPQGVNDASRLRLAKGERHTDRENAERNDKRYSDVCPGHRESDGGEAEA